MLTTSSSATARTLLAGALAILGCLLLPTVACAQTYTKTDLPIGIAMADRLDPMGANTNVLWDGSTITNFVDDEERMVDMGFTTTFYGAPAGPMIRVSSNGYVTFGTDGTDGTEDPIPSTIDPDAYIAVFWDDLNIFQQSMTLVMTETRGTAPNRVFIVEYANMDAAAGSADVTGQIRISENGDIELRYIDPSATPMPNYGGITSAVAGIENADGSDGVGGPSVDGTFTGTNPPANNYRFTYVPPQGTDLVGGSVSIAPAGAVQGDTIQVTASLSNLGTTPTSSAFRVGIYLSDDATIDLSDTLIGMRAVGSLGGVSSFTFTTSTVIPQIVSGSYFIGVVVDDQNAITENDELNNASSNPASLNLSTAYRVAPFTMGMTSINMAPGVTVLDDAANASFDDVLYNVTLPFDFEYFGEVFTANTTLRVSSNGFVSFIPQTSSHFSNDPLPDTFDPDGMVAPLWDDLRGDNATGTARLLTIVEGTAPNRVLVVEWFQIQRFSASGSLTHQVRFFEGTNVIEFHYPTTTLNYVNVSATIGIENRDGTDAVAAFDPGNQISTAPTDNYRFTPIPPTPGDANRDGVVNVADVQETINQVIRLSTPTSSGDFDRDGMVDIRDVQLVINRVLMGP